MRLLHRAGCNMPGQHKLMRNASLACHCGLPTLPLSTAGCSVMFWGVDLYRVLGLSPDASIEDVHAAYAAARRNRPHAWSARLLALLQGRSPAAQDHAHRVLSDPALRAAYEQQLDRSLWLMQFPPGH